MECQPPRPFGVGLKPLARPEALCAPTQLHGSAVGEVHRVAAPDVNLVVLDRALEHKATGRVHISAHSDGIDQPGKILGLLEPFSRAVLKPTYPVVWKNGALATLSSGGEQNGGTGSIFVDTSSQQTTKGERRGGSLSPAALPRPGLCQHFGPMWYTEPCREKPATAAGGRPPAASALSSRP